MVTRSGRHIEHFGTTFDDPVYDRILREFAIDHPQEYRAWRSVERALFVSRAGLGAYPDQLLMKACQAHLQEKLVDRRGSLGTFHVWKVLRGRIVRALLEQDPSLHPAPGKILMTEPRTCTDSELIAVVELFKGDHPLVWDQWARVETSPDRWGDDPLRTAQLEFFRFVSLHCWVMSSTAITAAFVAVRRLYFLTVRPTSMN